MDECKPLPPSSPPPNTPRVPGWSPAFRAPVPYHQWVFLVESQTGEEDAARVYGCTSTLRAHSQGTSGQAGEGDAASV